MSRQAPIAFLLRQMGPNGRAFGRSLDSLGNIKNAHGGQGQGGVAVAAGQPDEPRRRFRVGRCDPEVHAAPRRQTFELESDRDA